MNPIIDSTEIIEEVEAFESDYEEMLEVAENHKDEPEFITALLNLYGVTEDTFKEYKEQKTLCEDAGGDFSSGIPLIPDDRFVEYAQEMLEDCGDLPRNLPDYIVIDWDATAATIQQDYTCADIGGVTYWFRE